MLCSGVANETETTKGGIHNGVLPFFLYKCFNNQLIRQPPSALVLISVF